MRNSKESSQVSLDNTGPGNSSQQLALPHDSEPVNSSSRTEDAAAVATSPPSAASAHRPSSQVAPSTAGSPGNAEYMGQSTWAERDAALRLQAIPLTPFTLEGATDPERSSSSRSPLLLGQTSDSQDPSTPTYIQPPTADRSTAKQEQRQRARRRRQREQELYLQREAERNMESSDARSQSSDSDATEDASSTWYEQRQPEEQQQQQRAAFIQQSEQQHLAEQHQWEAAMEQQEQQQINQWQRQWEAAVEQHEQQQLEQRQQQELSGPVTRYDHAGRPARARRSARRLEERAAHANGDAEAQPTWLAEASMLMDALRVAV